MPGEPKRNVTKIGEGQDAVQHQFLVGASNGVYMVAYQEHRGVNGDDSAAIENLFVIGRDGFEKGIGGERTEHKTVTQAKLEGRETRFRIPAHGGLATTRMFFANHRWYQILVMGTADFVQSELSQKFLDSFKVTAAKASSKSSRKELIQKLKDF